MDAVTDVDITPAEVQQAAGSFAEGQWGIGFAWDLLATALDGCSGMAGNAPDRAALAFTPHYSKAVAAAWQAFRACVTSTGGMAVCLGKTAGNYLNADHHSTITGPGSGPPPLMPQPGVPLFGSRTQVVADKTLPPPPTVLGSGGSSLPGPLARLWPTADTGKLREAATAWQGAHARLSTIAGDLGTAIYSITEGNDTTDAEAINHVWSKIYSPCNDSTVLGALIDLCAGIAQSCTDYANAVDHARNQAELELGGAGVVGVVIIGAGLFFTPETGGASDAGAATANLVLANSILTPIAATLVAAVATLAAGALADHIIQATEESAANAPQVKPSDADSKSLEKSVGNEVKKSKEEVADQAGKLGYKRKISPQKAPFNSHGQPVYTDGKNYISPDVDSHNVTNGWKKFNRRGQRVGTYNWDLGTRLKD